MFEFGIGRARLVALPRMDLENLRALPRVMISRFNSNLGFRFASDYEFAAPHSAMRRRDETIICGKPTNFTGRAAAVHAQVLVPPQSLLDSFPSRGSKVGMS